MRKVIVEDRLGYTRAYLVRDEDPDDAAETYGIALQPPDLDRINFSHVKKKIHNELVRMGLFTWEDVVKHQNAVTRIVQAAIKREVIQLFKFEYQERKEALKRSENDNEKENVELELENVQVEIEV